MFIDENLTKLDPILGSIWEKFNSVRDKKIYKPDVE